MHDLTGFQRDCIRTIAQLSDPCGLDIKSELEYYYEGEVHHGRLYSNLDQLVEMGLVNKSEKDARTNEYSLTPRGKREVEFQLNEWEDAVEEQSSKQKHIHSLR